MILLIDGPDGTGKTTVCQMLSETLDIPVVKMPNMKEYFDAGSTEEYSKFFNDILVQFKGCSFIMDRGFTSSLVYSKIYQRPFDLSYIEQHEKDLGADVFILTVNNEEMFRRRPSDEVIVNEMRTEVRDEYEKLAAERNYVLIDTSSMTVKEVVDEILHYEG